MPFNAELPEEGTKPWFIPFTEWSDSLKEFVNGLETDSEATATGKVDRAKLVFGGQVPTPFRVPVLGVWNSWPNRRSPYRPVWVSGSTIYAYGGDNTLRKSTDGGSTWTRQGYNSLGFNAYGCFLKLASGTLLSISSVGGAVIQRSVDDGVTWTSVHTFRASRIPLGAQSWAVDATTGYIYYGEYTAGDQADVNIYRSIDDGATWTVFYTFNGGLTGGTGYIRHIHSMQWDPIAQRIIISTGDSTDWTGMWRTNAASTGIEKILTNDMLPSTDIDMPRSIGIIPFPDYIAWAGDTTLQPYLFRMARSEIGKPSPKVERVYRLNSSAWFTCRASDDGSRWVLSAAEEGNSIDNLVHLYAVEDQGATVWEVAAIPAPTSASAGALQPVGRPEMHGENFVMATRGFTNQIAWEFRMGSGVTPLTRPEPLPDSIVTQTASTGGIISLGPTEEKIFHISIAGGLARRLNILEAGVGLVDIGSASPGSLRMWIRKRGSAFAYETLNISERYTSRQDLGLAVSSVLFTGGDAVEFVIKNNHATGTITCLPTVTFGWGAA